MGSFSGHPVQQDVIAALDSGQIVITSKRIVYVGRLRSLSIDRAKLVSIQAYTDAVAVFHQGQGGAGSVQAARTSPVRVLGQCGVERRALAGQFPTAGALSSTGHAWVMQRMIGA